MRIHVSTDDGILRGTIEAKSLKELLQTVNNERWLIINGKGNSIAIATDKIISITEDKQ